MGNIQLYTDIKERNEQYVASGDIIVDDFLATPEADKRRGVTLLVPVPELGEKYQELVTRFVSGEPNQYYYPLSDLHVTVFTFISGTADYVPNDEMNRAFREITKDVLAGIKGIRIDFDGIVFSREAGIICGYDDDVLIEMRKGIRERLKKKGIPVLERYESKSSHVTFCRFKERLGNPKSFTATIKKNEAKYFGRYGIKNIHLVQNDWYNSERNRYAIERFEI
jgi:hypothetical protein